MRFSLYRLLGSRLFKVVSKIGNALGIAAFLFVVCWYKSDYSGRQRVVDRFRTATPNATITVDAKKYSATDLQSLSSGSFIVFFRSDETTMNAFRKKWEFNEIRLGTIDDHFTKEFTEWDLAQPVGGHYQKLLHKKLRVYDCWRDIFDQSAFGITFLYWDSETGTGLFYIRWGD